MALVTGGLDLSTGGRGGGGGIGRLLEISGVTWALLGIWTEIGAKFTLSALELKPTGLLDILGLSARLIGGGPTLKEEFLLTSPDRLGGGGEGGSEDGYEAGGAVDVGLEEIIRVGDGDNFRPPLVRGGRSVTSLTSASRPLAAWTDSAKCNTASGRLGKVGAALATSPEFAIFLKPFGETPLIALLLVGWAFAICSK
ncbi:hypothetical protein SS1G_01620 [Sclerotinia sclerotiorum 1980 UF-70]|uniref:Uncharacterized protein n=1 Tax=Sclerotinia sclerotiorum (strain ATCC 18683 / 1980 / Ss-1) TaxID=665079 RepID=A7E8J2_SCLS1|nr:hypothetical protein SS1G_01620 [Sclerotinia sclerotiorum 1980 UF-70]EDN96694.1 hypothetical protein SS1G_01620 [Sclerotinia sclerotiorum 1980 UF-70]